MEMQDATKSLANREATNAVSNLTSIWNGCKGVAHNGSLLLEVISEVDQSYAENVDRLSEALGHIQFQDVMRQRMQHVQLALVEMRDHLIRLSEKTSDPTWEGNLENRFGEMLAAQSHYRMASQTSTHAAITGSESAQAGSGPAIELF